MCKGCRFRLCLEAGMSHNRIKMGRIPNLKKQTHITSENIRVIITRDGLETNQTSTEYTDSGMHQNLVITYFKYLLDYFN